MTRSIFIIIFILILIDNHSGYDLPWAYHRLAPSGLIAGPRVHHDHHVTSNR